ncbi:MAG TPA: hypothetical protein VJS64_12835 [Pyrinomonadaceae bacterium]|nr:hypothetical protein [Pyrinomonadaceae bacterium]
MKKRTTITTRKREVWIIRNGSKATEEENLGSRESVFPPDPGLLAPDQETDSGPPLTEEQTPAHCEGAPGSGAD